MATKELEPRVARMEAAVEAIAKSLDGIHQGMRDLNGRIDRLFFWILGTFLAVSLQIWLKH